MIVIFFVLISIFFLAFFFRSFFSRCAGPRPRRRPRGTPPRPSTAPPRIFLFAHRALGSPGPCELAPERRVERKRLRSPVRPDDADPVQHRARQPRSPPRSGGGRRSAAPPTRRACVREAEERGGHVEARRAPAGARRDASGRAPRGGGVRERPSEPPRRLARRTSPRRASGPGTARGAPHPLAHGRGREHEHPGARRDGEHPLSPLGDRALVLLERDRLVVLAGRHRRVVGAKEEEEQRLGTRRRAKFEIRGRGGAPRRRVGPDRRPAGATAPTRRLSAVGSTSERTMRVVKPEKPALTTLARRP